MRLTCVVLGVWLAGCKADIPDGIYACDEHEDCPSGFECVPEGDGGSYWGGARWGGYGFTTLEAPNTTVADKVYACKSTTWPKAPCQSIGGTDQLQVFARSSHPGGVQSALADGSVRFISNTINLTTWRALGTKAGGEVVSDF